MLDLSLLPLFFSAIFFLAISPGPDLLLISTYSSGKGFIAGVMISLGVLVAGVIQTCLVAFGLGEIMMLMPNIALAIKLVGVLYLSYLGVKMLKAWYQVQYHKSRKGSQNVVIQVPTHHNALSSSNPHSYFYAGLFYKGLLNNLLNPKALLFFSLFLPQFTHQEASLTGQILLLGAMLSVFVFLINLLFSFAFSQLRKRVGRHLTLGQHIDGILGLIFLGLAARLATSK